MTSTLRHRLLTAAILSATVLGVGACSSDPADDTGAGTTSTSVDPSAAPADISWNSWQGVNLPTSAVDGPTTVDGDVAAGYAHSPQGAALAAIQGTLRLAMAPDTSWPAVANSVAAPGEGRDSYAVNRALVTVTGPAPAGSAPQIKGFRVQDYTPTRTVVNIAAAQPDTTLVAATQTMVWSGEDWKILLPAPGSETAPQTLSDLSGYTALEATS